jgi:type IV pilus assembly protein PilA
MLSASLSRVKDDRGFTLIELLVVILIIGVLAAIAIPAFLNQKGKAYDASAKEMVRTASQAAETYSTDHNGEYGGIKPEVLHEYEAAIQTKGPNAYVTVAEATESGRGYAITATAPTTKDTFTIVRNEHGEVTRTCKSESKGCSGSSSGSW